MQPNHSHAWNPSEVTIENRITGQKYRLLPANKLPALEGQEENIAAICNQTAIYNFLFRDRLGGHPYQPKDAQSFLSWAESGWKEQKYFVFFLVDQQGLVAGALDIKSADRSKAEVGYWCSEHHRGLMSNAVNAMIELARSAGYKSLWARIVKDNAASRKVLERSGFTLTGDWSEDPSREHFERTL